MNHDSIHSAKLARVTIVLIVLALGCGACLSSGRPRFEALEARAWRFEAVPGRAVVYFYRDQPIAPTFRIGLRVNGGVIGALDTHSFILCDFEPGTLSIESGEDEPATLELETEAGGIYYVRHEYGDLAFDGRTELHVATAATAQEKIEELRGIPSSCGR